MRGRKSAYRREKEKPGVREMKCEEKENKLGDRKGVGERERKMEWREGENVLM